MLLAGQDLHLAYGRTAALRGVEVEVREGEIVALTGQSGSGKTSLLYCLAGIVPPSQGRVTYRGRALMDLGDQEFSKLRREEFGFIFQFGELVPELTIGENVALPLRLNGVHRRDAESRALEMLGRLGIAGEASRRPSEAAGGQAQRAAVARALIHHPRLVFADEPTGSLDTENKGIVLQELIALARGADAAVLLVTHEVDVAEVADRRVTLKDGRTTDPVQQDAPG